MSKYSKDRTLILCEQINQKSVKDIIKSITDINSNDDQKAKEFKKFKRKPIHMILNTYGGVVYDGLGLISAIENSATPIHITVMGSAMSMGLFILVSAQKRSITKHSTIMYHQISTFSWDKIEGVKNDVKEAERLEQVCEQILFNKSKVKPKHLAPFKTQKKEWFIDPKQALKLGIVDKII